MNDRLLKCYELLIFLQKYYDLLMLLAQKRYGHVSCFLLKQCYVMMNHVRVTLFLHQKDRLIVLR